MSLRGRRVRGARPTRRAQEWHHPKPVEPAAETTGLIVVDHGSRRAESNAMHERLVAMIVDVVPFAIVEPAHMEIAEPSIDTAFGRCVAAGASLVVVSPYFLFPGRHWSDDIPELVRQAAAAHPGVRSLVTAPLGLHPLMAEVVAQRVEHCVAHAFGRAPECEVCAGTGRCGVDPGAAV